MKVFIQPNPLYYSILNYTFRLFAFNKGLTFQLVTEKSDADIVLDESPESNFPIAVEFYKKLSNRQFDYHLHFTNECLIYENAKPDYFATCFYMINSLQEYVSERKDELGRFPYKSSYQFQFSNITQNLVQAYFDKMAEGLKIHHHKSERSVIFISHDIDNITTAWLEDGFAALKKGKYAKLLSLLFHAVIQKPDWFNMDKIMQLHDEYSFKSTFFWLANKGRINKRMVNADYDVRNKRIQQSIGDIRKSGFENGIHKSISPDKFPDEIKRLGFQPIANRYHYLKFNLPSAYNELQAANIMLDASLGFAEQYGFRNSYGQAFQPFNLEQNKPYHLIEVPLHVMDRTFYSYLKTPVTRVADTTINFFEQNKFDCTLSLLWHNTFFDSIKFDGYLTEYKKILAYLYENDFKSVSQEELINKHLIFK